MFPFYFKQEIGCLICHLTFFGGIVPYFNHTLALTPLKSETRAWHPPMSQDGIEQTSYLGMDLVHCFCGEHGMLAAYQGQLVLTI